MPDQVVMTVQEIQTIFIRAHPQVALMVFEYGRNTVRPDDIMRSEFCAEIAKDTMLDGLHEYTLLEQTQPDVSRLILDDRIHLGMGKVGFWRVERIVGEQIRFRVESIETVTITS